MRRIIILFSLLLIYKISVAQENIPARPAVNTTTSSYQKIDELNETAFNIYLTTPDSARKLAESALLLSQKAGYAYGKGKSFYNIGLVYWLQSYYTVSLYYFNSAANYFPASQPLELSDCYNAIGRIYADLGNYEQAEIHLQRSLILAGNDK